MQNLLSDILVQALFMFVWIIFGFAALNFGQIRRLKKLAANLRGSLAFYSLFLPAVEGIYENIRFSVHAGPRFLEIPGTLKIRLFVRPLLVLRVFRRSMLAKAAGKIMQLNEVKTGDTLFDAEFALFARNTEMVCSYLQHTAVRNGLRAMLEYGFWMLAIDDHGSWAEKLAYDRKVDLKLPRVSAFLRYLKAIATGV